MYQELPGEVLDAAVAVSGWLIGRRGDGFGAACQAAAEDGAGINLRKT
jgi:hypothetical protein